MEPRTVPLQVAANPPRMTVGTVGTILGEGGINISRMQLALVPERKEAAMLVNIDGPPSAEVMGRLRNVSHMISAQMVEL